MPEKKTTHDIDVHHENSHFLHIAESAKVIDDVIVVHDVAKVLAVLVGPISIEENVRTDVGVDLLLGHRGEGPEGMGAGLETVRINTKKAKGEVQGRAHGVESGVDSFANEEHAG